MKQLYYKALENIEAFLVGLLIVIMPIVYFSKTVLDPVLFPRYLALSIWLLLIIVVIGFKMWKGKFHIILDRSHKIIFVAAAIYILVNIISFAFILFRITR